MPSSSEWQDVLNSPALTPPPGVTPQLDNPPNAWGFTKGIIIFCNVLVTLSLLMRLYTRWRVFRQIDSADYAIIIGWALFVSYTVPCWLLSRYAARVHQWDIPVRNIPLIAKYLRLASILFGICTFFNKLSILLSYIQIFAPGGTSNRMWWYYWIIIAGNFVFYLVSTVLESITCSIPGSLAEIFPEKHCIHLDLDIIFLTSSCINCTTDILILFLPQLVIWRLNMSFHKKLAVSAVFLLGLVACASAAVRLSYTIKLQSSDDQTYLVWFMGIWSLPEMASEIVIACVPVSVRFYQSVVQSFSVWRLKGNLRHLAPRKPSWSEPPSDERLDESRTPSSHEHEMKNKKNSDGVRSQITAGSERSQNGLEEGRSQNNAVFVVRSIQVYDSTEEGQLPPGWWGSVGT